MDRTSDKDCAGGLRRSHLDVPFDNACIALLRLVSIRRPGRTPAIDEAISRLKMVISGLRAADSSLPAIELNDADDPEGPKWL